MDWQGLAYVITSIASLVSAVMSGVAAVYAARTKVDLHHVKNEMNGMKDALVKAAAKAGEMKGRAAGAEEERQKQIDT